MTKEKVTMNLCKKKKQKNKFNIRKKRLAALESRNLGGLLVGPGSWRGYYPRLGISTPQGEIGPEPRGRDRDTGS